MSNVFEVKDGKFASGTEAHDDIRGGVLKDGWYFYDEGYGENGPYASKEEAERGLKEYADQL